MYVIAMFYDLMSYIMYMLLSGSLFKKLLFAYGVSNLVRRWSNLFTCRSRRLMRSFMSLNWLFE